MCGMEVILSLNVKICLINLIFIERATIIDDIHLIKIKQKLNVYSEKRR
jgi:hypothetical protein